MVKTGKRGRMTTELEQEFFKVFGVEPKMLCNCEFKNLYDYRIEYGSDVCDYTESKIKEPCKVCKKAKQKVPLYPEITDRKLLQLLCIYNDMQGCVETCITPCKYEDAKEMILSTLVNERFAMIDCDKGTYMDVMTKQIQKLFEEEE